MLADVMRDIRAVGKSERNAEQGFNFRGIDAVVNEVAPRLREHRVLVLPHAVDVATRDVQTRGGKTAREVTVTATYRFLGPVGDSIDVQVVGGAMDTSDKATSKAMSVAWRTALIQALCLPTGEPDPDHDSYERADEQATSEEGEQERLRGQIAELASEQGVPLPTVAEDFRSRTREDIRTANTTLLSHYLGHVRLRGFGTSEPEETSS